MSSSSSSFSSLSPSSQAKSKEKLAIEEKWRARYTVLNKIELEGREFPSDILLNDVFKNILAFSDAETHRNVFYTSKRTMSYYQHMGRNLFHNLQLTLGISDVFHSHEKCGLWRVMLPHVEDLKIDLDDQKVIDEGSMIERYKKSWLSIQSKSRGFPSFGKHAVSLSRMSRLKNLFIKGSISEIAEILAVCMEVAPQLESISLQPINPSEDVRWTSRTVMNFYSFLSRCENLRHFCYDESLIDNAKLYNYTTNNVVLARIMGVKARENHPKLESLELYKLNVKIPQSCMLIDLPLKRFALTTQLLIPDTPNRKFSQSFQEGLEYLDTTSTILPKFFEVAHFKNLREMHLEIYDAFPLSRHLILPSVEILTITSDYIGCYDLNNFPNLKHLTCKRSNKKKSMLMDMVCNFKNLESLKLDFCDLDPVNTLNVKHFNKELHSNRYQYQVLKNILQVPLISLVNCQITLGFGRKRLGDILPSDRDGIEVLYDKLLQEFIMMEAELEDRHREMGLMELFRED